MISQILYPVVLTVLFYLLYYVAQFLYRELTYPLRNVAGPKSPSFIFGSFKQLKVASSSERIVIIVIEQLPERRQSSRTMARRIWSNLHVPEHVQRL
jgi:hypothetical protein